jgi:DNA-binding MarR family transcriptional regulator
LGGIYSGKRPIQLAQSLKISPQVVSYHIGELIEAGLIFKGKDRNGRLMWRLTERGSFFLKEKLTWSVKRGNNLPNSIPVRIHRYTLEFKIKSIPERLNRLDWIPLKNEIFKSIIRYPDHTEELIRSPNEWASALLVHLPEEYFLDHVNGMVKSYNDACDYANTTAQRLNIEISSRGKVICKPHFAFEDDLIAMFLATFETAEVATKGGNAWIDSNTGNGELETNDSDYVYDYLKMPEIVKETYEIVSRMKQKPVNTGYRKYYDPILSENN